MNKSRLLAATLVALAGVVVVARFAVAGSSFLGQGVVPFDQIKVGLNDAYKIQLNGTILNSRSGKPVLIGDALRVTGNITAPGLSVWGTSTLGAVNAGSLTSRGGLTVTGTTAIGALNISGWIAAPGDAIVGIDDDLRVKKNLFFDGTLYAGTTNYSSRIDTNAQLTTAITGFVDCIGQASQFTTYIQSSDFRTCFNSWLAGKPKSVP